MIVPDWLAGVIVTASASAVAYGLKRYFDWRVDRAVAADLEIHKRKLIAEFETLTQLQGVFLEVNHYIHRVRQGRDGYVEKCAELCAKARQDSRRAVAFLDSELVSWVHTLTDSAQHFLKTRSDERFEAWLGLYRSSPFASHLDTISESGTALITSHETNDG